MKKILLPLMVLALSICARAQQSVNCNISATQAQQVTSLTCNPAPINGFTVTFPATVNQVTVSVSPTSVTLTPGATQQFTATVSNASNTNVTWTSSGGTITSGGLYTAGSTTGSSFTATATSVQNPSISASATITITNGTVSAENAYCTPSGTWIGSTVDGPASLPTACLDTALSNTPSPGVTHGPFTTLSALQASINSGACGDIHTVTAGSNLVGTLTLPAKSCDNAHWITIESTGVSNGSFPAEGSRMTPCWGGVASLPGRPAYPCPSPTNLLFTITGPIAGQAVIDNGDHYRIIGAKITRTQTHGIVFSLVTLPGTSAPFPNNLILDRVWGEGVEGTGTFPQSTSTSTETKRFLDLGQSNHVALINSYITNMYCDGSISGCDSQVVGGGVGSTANSNWGVYKVYNNHMEAASESILIGGANGPPLTPSGCTIKVNCNIDVTSDIEVRSNYFFKPLAWDGNTTVPISVGWPVEKNGFEMKMGNRALFEGNVIENTWYSAQVGMCYSIAPKNQSNGTGTLPTAPTALTNNFTYRYNYCYNASYGLGLYQSQDANCPTCYAQGADGISIHDNIFGDDLNLGSLTSISSGDAAEITNSPDPTNSGLNQINHVNLSHNTFVRAIRYSIAFGGFFGQMNSWTIQNNIFVFGTYGVGANPSTGGCVGSADSTDNFNLLLTNCVTNQTTDHNALFNMTGTLGSKWPTNSSGLGNWFFTSPTASGNYLNPTGQTASGSLGFANYGTGNSGFNPLNYAITSSSPLFNAGSDGKSVGADAATINSMIAGVRQ